jgi:hypothetical protein
VKDIQKLIGLSIPVVSEHAFPATGKIAEKKEQPTRFNRSKSNFNPSKRNNFSSRSVKSN